MFNFSSKESRLKEEYLYSIVTKEIEQNEIHKPLYTKALADAQGNQQQAQSLYIKYRVQKLKDDISDNLEQQEKERERNLKHQEKIDKQNKNLTILNTTVANTLRTFRFLTSCLVLVSIGFLFISYVLRSSTDSWKTWLFIGILLISLRLYLFYIIKKIKKIEDHKKIKKQLNILFFVLIPFSLLGSIVGVWLPILGLAMFIIFVTLLIRAFKFYTAFHYAKRNNLI
jgi:F0F1-type ATP synthase assembly protein I